MSEDSLDRLVNCYFGCWYLTCYRVQYLSLFRPHQQQQTYLAVIKDYNSKYYQLHGLVSIRRTCNRLYLNLLFGTKLWD